MARVRGALPTGQGLTEHAWGTRHRVILGLLVVHVPGVFIFAVARGFSPVHSLMEAALVGVPALLAWRAPGRRARTGAATVGLLMASGVLTHLSGGTIEMHFHFFVMVGVITAYQDWFPFLLAIGFVVAHHGVMGAVDPHGVYNHPAAQRHPWTWAAIHGVFILGASAAHLVNWRLSERAHQRAESYALRLREEDLRRRQALEINDNVVQGLVVAKYALDAGDARIALEALERTLDSARGIIGDLLTASDARLGPGDLVREAAVGPLAR